MKWYEILIIGLTVVIIIYIMQLVYRKMRYNNIIFKISSIISNMGNHEAIKAHHVNNYFNIESKQGKNYRFKIIDMNPFHEVIITNADNVVINENISDWKRSTKPHFVPRMKDFINNEKNDSQIVKVVLIYPGCHNITKYINESDAYIVEKFQRVDGLYFIRFNNLEEFLTKH